VAKEETCDPETEEAMLKLSKKERDRLMDLLRHEGAERSEMFINHLEDEARREKVAKDAAKNGMVTLKYHNGTKLEGQPAYVLGQWAAHPGIRSDDLKPRPLSTPGRRWTVSHVRLGRRLRDADLTKKEARQLLVALQPAPQIKSQKDWDSGYPKVWREWIHDTVRTLDYSIPTPMQDRVIKKRRKKS
jgi:hypothetical protein